MVKLQVEGEKCWNLGLNSAAYFDFGILFGGEGAQSRGWTANDMQITAVDQIVFVSISKPQFEISMQWAM